ncbi:MAG: zinc-dependent alcohol dehydrogenase family protein [Anaerolineae bacterium]|jgi:propanol-preferring alcohol dehydrogenase
MKAMVLHAPRPAEKAPLEVRDLPLPEPGAEEIRLRVRACGVCHTDLHTVEGDLPLPKLPVVPGHQVVGIVDAVGEGVQRFTIGQRVGVPWLYRTCGTCEFCRRGMENLCRQARFTGLHADGGYAEAMVVHQDFAYPIPETFSDESAAPLLCAGIIGYRALRLSGVRPGERLGMWGFGASAHITLQIARYWGCEVYVFTRGEKHRQLAKELGAAWVGSARDNPPGPVHGGIIFAPAGGLVPEALRVLERGGTLALAGVTMTPIPELDYDRLLYWERAVRSVANFTRQDAAEFLRLAAEVPVQTKVQTFPLEAANEALLALKEGRINGAGVLVL